MADNTIYIVLGVVAVVYIFISMTNRRQSKSRKSRKFMEGYKSRDRDKKEKE